MNVLILTPDAVGSTLLQRVITIYMQLHEYDKPVINLHELTNGLIKYYSPDFNRELLGKKNANWGYHQTLEEIVELLASVDHYKTSRLAQYHIKNRQDTLDQQIPFYRYLNDNFYIISCRRENVFEHALSWGLNKITKKLNVYSANEKISTFYNMYKEQVELDINVFVESLDVYKNYIKWADDHFDVASYFQYDDHLNDLEKYVLGLPIFQGQPKISWNDTYGISFDDWNRCHYYTSNIGALALDQPAKFLQLTHTVSNSDSTDIAELNHNNIIQYLPPDQQKFLENNINNYTKASESIRQMHKLGILVSGIPIKKQTLREKRYMIKNFNQCVDAYNDWIAQNPSIGQPFVDNSLAIANEKQSKIWSPGPTTSTTALSALPPID